MKVQVPNAMNSIQTVGNNTPYRDRRRSSNDIEISHGYLEHAPEIQVTKPTPIPDQIKKV